jgi:hypothetical protein
MGWLVSRRRAESGAALSGGWECLGTCSNMAAKGWCTRIVFFQKARACYSTCGTRHNKRKRQSSGSQVWNLKGLPKNLLSALYQQGYPRLKLQFLVCCKICITTSLDIDPVIISSTCSFTAKFSSQHLWHHHEKQHWRICMSKLFLQSRQRRTWVPA